MNNPWETPALAVPVAPVNPFKDWTPDQVLRAHQEAELRLGKAKELEMALRLEVVARYFANETKPKGTFNFELGNGYKLKLEKKQYIKVGDIPEGKALEDTLDEIAKIGNVGSVLADRLVKFSPELSVTEYNKLDDADDQEKRIKALIDAHITVTPATPTIKIVEPKNK